MVCQFDRIVAGEAGIAILRLFCIATIFAHGPVQPVEGDEGQAVRADEGAHLGEIILRGQQLVAARRIDAIEAAMGRRRAGNAHMHLTRAGLAHHLHDFSRGGAAHDGIIDQHNTFAVDDVAVGVMLELDAEMADLVRRLNKGAADIMVADDAEIEGDAAFLRIADGGGGAAVGHRDDEIGVDGVFARKLAAD